VVRLCTFGCRTEVSSTEIEASAACVSIGAMLGLAAFLDFADLTMGFAALDAPEVVRFFFVDAILRLYTFTGTCTTATGV
jgi:hypothetical protein